MNKYILPFFLLLVLLISGCSTNEPQITEILIEDLKYDSDTQKLTWTLNVKYAQNEKLEIPNVGILRISFDDGSYTTDKEFSFFPGQQNNYKKVSFYEDNYIIGDIVSGKVELIQGTKVIDSKEIEVIYNG